MEETQQEIRIRIADVDKVLGPMLRRRLDLMDSLKKDMKELEEISRKSDALQILVEELRKDSSLCSGIDNGVPCMNNAVGFTELPVPSHIEKVAPMWYCANCGNKRVDGWNELVDSERAKDPNYPLGDMFFTSAIS